MSFAETAGRSSMVLSGKLIPLLAARMPILRSRGVLVGGQGGEILPLF